MKILVTGKNGQVGNALSAVLAPLAEIVAVGSEDCDLKNQAAIVELVERVKPAIIVNPAAYTAVDKAESDQEAAFAVNAVAPKVLAAQANMLGIPLIHYSTDYVFDGVKSSPYNESDVTNPQSIYGLSKFLGEENVRVMTPNHVILRTSWVYGTHGTNFLKTILRLAREKTELKIIDDQFGAPTSTRLIASVTYKFVDELLYGRRSNKELFGTYHLVPNGTTTWCRYAKKIVSHAAKSGVEGLLSEERIYPIETSEYPLPAARPQNSCMYNSKLSEKLHMKLSDWESDLEAVLNDLINH